MGKCHLFAADKTLLMHITWAQCYVFIICVIKTSGPQCVFTKRRVPGPAKSDKAERGYLHPALLEIISWCS